MLITIVGLLIGLGVCILAWWLYHKDGELDGFYDIAKSLSPIIYWVVGLAVLAAIVNSGGGGAFNFFF